MNEVDEEVDGGVEQLVRGEGVKGGAEDGRACDDGGGSLAGAEPGPKADEGLAVQCGSDAYSVRSG